MARTIVIATIKGGPGKSTSTLNLSAALSQLGYRVLLADADSQATCTRQLLDDAATIEHGMHDIFAGTPMPATELVQQTRFENLFVLPTDDRLRLHDLNHGFELSLDTDILRYALNELDTHFDFVLIDAPPRDHLSGYAALVAADLVCAIFIPEPLVYEGIISFQNNIAAVRESKNPNLAIRYLINDSNRSAIHRTIIEKARAAHGSDVLQTEIAHSDIIPKAQLFRTPITHYEANSIPAQTMLTLGREIVDIFAHEHQSSSQIINEHPNHEIKNAAA